MKTTFDVYEEHIDRGEEIAINSTSLKFLEGLRMRARARAGNILPSVEEITAIAEECSAGRVFRLKSGYGRIRAQLS
jgi:hypothetical protein